MTDRSGSDTQARRGPLAPQGEEASVETAQGPQAAWLSFLRMGRLMLQQDAAGRVIFPPRVAAPQHGGPLSWIEARGTGRIYSLTIEHPRPPHPPQALVLVTLDEGVRMLSRMPGVDPKSIRIGDRVRARIIADAETPYVIFEPAS